MKLRHRRSAALLAVPLLAPVLALAACGGSGSSSSSSASSSGSSAASSSGAAATGSVTSLGVKVTGAFGAKPTVQVPSKAAPTGLSSDVLTAGTGATAAKGDLIVVNYLGQTWEPKDGKVNVFDNSFDKKQPFGFALGSGSVIKGWDQGLEGKKVGSRVLLAIPPALAYGTEKNDQSGLGGQTLVFVVDILRTIGKDAAAKGEAVTPTAKGLPDVASEPGKRPEIRSVQGVKPGTTPVSALLVKGDGEKIDPAKTVALQLVQTDTATGKQTQQTWGQGLQSVPAQQVLATVSALKDASVGSRAVLVTPQAGGQPSFVVVLDVVGQY